MTSQTDRWKCVGRVSRFPIVSSARTSGSATSPVVENMRLGHALAMVKAQQDLKRVTKVMNNSEKTGYKKSPQRAYEPDFEKTAVEMTV